jgi:hypothetical protein
MSLDAVKRAVDSSEHNETYLAEIAAPFEKWQNFPVSQISHHGGVCCETAREWLSAMDFSNLNGGSVMTGPRWIRQRYNWGPTRWQIHWCEAVRQNALDCGAQASLAKEVFSVRGVTSYPAQLVQQYSNEATRHWSQKWDGQESSTHWINEDLIYHEGVAVVVRDNEIKIWDASAGWWINPKQASGYGGLRALRLFNPGDEPYEFFWGEHKIVPNQWQKIR